MLYCHVVHKIHMVCIFIHHYWYHLVCNAMENPLKQTRLEAMVTKRIMYVLEWRNVSTLAGGLFLCLFPELRSNEGNKHPNNTRVSVETVRHKSTYIILFLTWHNESINNDKNNYLFTLSLCLTRSVFILLMTSQSIADDVTMTRQLWCDHVISDI